MVWITHFLIKKWSPKSIFTPPKVVPDLKKVTKHRKNHQKIDQKSKKSEKNRKKSKKSIKKHPFWPILRGFALKNSSKTGGTPPKMKGLRRILEKTRKFKAFFWSKNRFFRVVVSWLERFLGGSTPCFWSIWSIFLSISRFFCGFLDFFVDLIGFGGSKLIFRGSFFNSEGILWANL